MGFHTAVTNGLFDWIGDALAWVIDHILGFFLPPLVWLAQQIFIVIPLEILDGMVKIFKFFSMGFTPYIFGTSVNPDGSISYAFDWNGPVAKVMFTVFILAMMMFTFFFLLSFTKNHTIDESGRPTMMQSKRLVALKWPTMMALLLLFTPILLVVADTFVSLFISSFGNDVGKVMTDDDIKNFNDNFVNGLWTNYRSAVNSGTIKIGGDSMFQWIQAKDGILKSIAKQMKDNTSPYYSFGMLPSKINDCCDTLDEMYTYLTSGIQNTNTALNNLKLEPGYLTNDQADSIRKCIDQISNFSYNSIYLKTQFAELSDPNNSSFVSAWADWDTMKGNDDPSSETIRAWCGQYISGMTTGNNDKNYMNYWFGTETTSATFRLLNATIKNNGTIGLHDLASRNKGIQDFSLCPVLYTFATGDDPANWREGPKMHFGNFDLIRALIGVFMIFAMFLIVYTYLQAVIKRIYLIIGYWIIGWFFLANGMNEPGPAKNWYKTLFGTWIGVLFLYICFEMAGVLEGLIADPVKAGLSKYDEGAKNIALVSTAGSLFCIEAAYQVMFQVSNKAMTSLGTSESGAKGFSGGSSMALTKGKAMAMKSAENAFSLATAKPLRDAKQSWIETKDYWADRKDKMLGREAQSWNYAKNQLEFADNQKKANDVGYTIQKPKVGDFLKQKFNGAKLVPTVVGHEKGSPYFDDPKRAHWWSRPTYFDGRKGRHNRAPGKPPKVGNAVVENKVVVAAKPEPPKPVNPVAGKKPVRTPAVIHHEQRQQAFAAKASIDNDLLFQQKNMMNEVKMPAVEPRPLPNNGAIAGYGKQTIVDVENKPFNQKKAMSLGVNAEPVDPSVRPVAAVTSYDEKGMPVYGGDKVAVDYSQGFDVNKTTTGYYADAQSQKRELYNAPEESHDFPSNLRQAGNSSENHSWDNPTPEPTIEAAPPPPPKPMVIVQPHVGDGPWDKVKAAGRRVVDKIDSVEIFGKDKVNDRNFGINRPLDNAANKVLDKAGEVKEKIFGKSEPKNKTGDKIFGK